MLVRFTIWLIAGIFTAICSSAQQIEKITAAQYFFDEDSGAGKGKPLTLKTFDTSVTIVDSIFTSSLKSGFHTLNICVKNSEGKWSIPESRSFYVAGKDTAQLKIAKITAAQYFFDNDSGVGKAKPLTLKTSDTSVAIVDSISAFSLKPGFHTIGIRTKNSEGKWCIFENRSFYVAGKDTVQLKMGKVTAAQYFFDNDSGVGKAKPLTLKTSDTSVAIVDSISAFSLKPGFHTIAIRTKNSEGKWSIFENRSFYVGKDTAQLKISKITAAQYFFDKDPGVAKGVPLKLATSDTSVSLADSISTSISASLFGKNHWLTIRVKDNTGKWSIFSSQAFSFPHADKDRDGIADYDEPRYGTDYRNFDTNVDGLADGVNVFTGLKPTATDTDGDGLSNIKELLMGTSPILKDTDGDGVTDNVDAFPLDRFKTSKPPQNLSDHTAPVIILLEPF